MVELDFPLLKTGMVAKVDTCLADPTLMREINKSKDFPFLGDIKTLSKGQQRDIICPVKWNSTGWREVMLIYFPWELYVFIVVIHKRTLQGKWPCLWFAKNKCSVRNRNTLEPKGSFADCLQRIPDLFTGHKYPKASVSTVIINVFKEQYMENTADNLAMWCWRRSCPFLLIHFIRMVVFPALWSPFASLTVCGHPQKLKILTSCDQVFHRRKNTWGRQSVSCSNGVISLYDKVNN